MKKSLALISLLVSASAYADNVSVYLGGQEIAGSDNPTSFNVLGDDVEVSSQEYEAVIYMEKNQSGFFATVKQGEQTPFPFKSIEIKKIPVPLEGKGLFFEVKKGTPCVDLAMEMTISGKSISLYTDKDVTYSLTGYGQPESRRFKKLCSVDGAVDANALAIAKVGLFETLKQKVKFTTFSESPVAQPDYYYVLTGHLPKKVGGDGEFTPDFGFDFSGNVGSWHKVLTLKTSSHVVSGR